MINKGLALEWPKFDLQLGIGNLVYDLIGPKFIEIESARRRGAVSSDKKKAASRVNGKLGGRPKKAGYPSLAIRVEPFNHINTRRICNVK